MKISILSGPSEGVDGAFVETIKQYGDVSVFEFPARRVPEEGIIIAHSAAGLLPISTHHDAVILMDPTPFVGNMDTTKAPPIVLPFYKARAPPSKPQAGLYIRNLRADGKFVDIFMTELEVIRKIGGFDIIMGYDIGHHVYRNASILAAIESFILRVISKKI